VGHVVCEPYLHETKPEWRKGKYEFFALLVKGESVEEAVEKLRKAGLKKENWKDSLSLKKPVASGYKGEMPLRNQKKELIPSNSLAIGSRVLVYVSCKTYMTYSNDKKGEWAVQFEMDWVRMMNEEIEKMIEDGNEEEEEEELGKDEGPDF
jgi:hypothetical protein